MIGADDDPHRNYEFACKVMRLLPIGPRGQPSVLIHKLLVNRPVALPGSPWRLQRGNVVASITKAPGSQSKQAAVKTAFVISGCCLEDKHGSFPSAPSSRQIGRAKGFGAIVCRLSTALF